MSEPIRFILNGALREVTGLPPAMTLLQYLRGPAHLTGTKEGCAEGDCGACTVIVGELADGKVSFKTVNACIAFLPTLDGRQIITVENLGASDALNPVQKAMVECHGSQCGFCTPGFVMSLAALNHNQPDADDTAIQDSIAGNLCRCTGYRSILDAARAANKITDGRTLAADPAALAKIERRNMFAYEANGKKFFAPLTAAELADILAAHPKATILAGGTDVGLWVTKRHLDLPVIIYTGNVAVLRMIKETDAGLEIGAAVTYSAAFARLAAYDESLGILLRRLGSVQIRNCGTIGGNIANGSPIGDGMPPLIALGASIVLHSKAGARTVRLEDYFIAYGEQDRKPSEFVETVIVPRKAKNVLFKTYKVSKRFDQDISAVCAAFALILDNGKITGARFAFGGMAATPKRAIKTEEIIIGRVWDEETARLAMKTLTEDFAPLTDMRASAEYRLLTARNLLYRCFIETTSPETETQVYSYAG